MRVGRGYSAEHLRPCDDFSSLRARRAGENTVVLSLDYTGNVVSTESFVEDELKGGDLGYCWDGETASPSMISVFRSTLRMTTIMRVGNKTLTGRYVDTDD